MECFSQSNIDNAIARETVNPKTRLGSPEQSDIYFDMSLVCRCSEVQVCSWIFTIDFRPFIIRIKCGQLIGSSSYQEKSEISLKPEQLLVVVFQPNSLLDDSCSNDFLIQNDAAIATPFITLVISERPRYGVGVADYRQLRQLSYRSFMREFHQ